MKIWFTVSEGAEYVSTWIGRHSGVAPKSSFDSNMRTTSGDGECRRKRKPPYWRLPHRTCGR